MPKYYMFNKPKGCVSARRDARHRTVMDYFPEEMRDSFFPVGRLDKDTEGLLVITDDGKLAHDILSPENHIEKTYFFWAMGIPDEKKLEEARRGIRIYKNSDTTTAPAVIILKDRSTMREIRAYLSDSDESLATRRGDFSAVSGIVRITEGKNHQVKRTVRYAEARVVYLRRVAMGELNLDEALAPGEYRELTDEEISLLKK